jgi:hypothetical protein
MWSRGRPGRVVRLRTSAARRKLQTELHMKARLALLPVGLLATTAIAGPSLILPTVADESVVSGSAEKNYGENLNRGGLFVGNDGTGMGISRFYLKFELPKGIEPSQVASARLWATYLDDLDRDDNGVHRIHFVAADDWQENTINWINQPGPTFGSPEATFDSSKTEPGTEVQFDVSDLVKTELAGDRMLSLMFAAANESTDRSNRNWEYFPEREFDQAKSFHLTIATGKGVGDGGPVAVPLPTAVWSAMATLAVAGFSSKLRRVVRR